MVFKIGYFLWFVLIFRCGSGSKCLKDNCVAVPLIDQLAAPLTAQLDITELNKQIGELIKDKVKQEVENALTKLVDNITDHRLRSAENKLTSDISNMMELNVRDLNETFGQQSSRLEERIDSYDRSLRQEIIKLTQASVKVGMTACVISESKRNGDTIVDFPNIKTSTGVSASDIASFKTSGVFTCRQPGLYFVAVTTDTHTTGSPNLFVYKKDLKVQRMRASSNDNASTGVVAVILQTNDTLYVKLGTVMMLHSDLSCLTIMKIN